MGLIVQKYGGSSLADKERILNVARRIVETKRDGNKVIAIVSAMGKTTDKLIQMAREISEVPPKREMDRLLSTGEQISMSLLAMAIQAMGEKAISLSGPQAGIMTDAYHSKARIKNVAADRLKKELEEDNIIIVAGFQGENADYDVTTLGRGGSDTSAVAIAAAVDADLCEIFTDVDGVYSCDPRIVPKAKKLKVVSYDEMLELAILGAKVLQHRSVELAKTHKVAVHVRSSFNHNLGTVVKEDTSMEHNGIITGIAHDFNVAKVVVFGVPDKPGIAARIFGEISKLDINIAIGGYVKSTIEVIGKTYEIGTGNVVGATERGESLRCLFSNINLGGTDISTDIEGADISIDNGIEAKGSLNSLYNVKIRRTKQVDTKVTIQKNEYEKNSFKDFKEKMIAGTPVTATIKLGDSSHNDLIVIEAPKLFINSNKRGDYKGSGSHNIDLQASVNNTEKSHLKITFKD